MSSAEVKEIESIYFDIVKEHSIISTRQAQLDEIFRKEGIDRIK